MKSIVLTAIGLLIGFGLLFAGVDTLGEDKVSCGTQTMSPGDVCSEIRNGSTTERGYDEQKADNRSTGWIMTGVGAGVLLGSAAVLVIGLARRNRVRGPAPAGQ